MDLFQMAKTAQISYIKLGIDPFNALKSHIPYVQLYVAKDNDKTYMRN